MQTERAPKLARFEEGLRASANANGHKFTQHAPHPLLRLDNRRQERNA